MATADAYWLKELEASGIGASKEDFAPEQSAAAEISERHVIAGLKEVLTTLTNAQQIAGHP